jgi:surfactin synthase thioesterase subunit
MATLVIIPGSFASTTSYKTFTDSLSRNVVESEVIDTPSVGRREGGPKTMSDDAAEITRVASTLLNRGKEVVLMTHSYGGIPGTQSLEKLSRKAREA